MRISSQWALNGKLAIKDGKLLLIPESAGPLEIDLKKPEDVVVHEHTFTPPGALEN